MSPPPGVFTVRLKLLPVALSSVEAKVTSPAPASMMVKLAVSKTGSLKVTVAPSVLIVPPPVSVRPSALVVRDESALLRPTAPPKLVTPPPAVLTVRARLLPPESTDEFR